MTPTLQDRARLALEEANFPSLSRAPAIVCYFPQETLETIREALRLAADPWNYNMDEAPKDTGVELLVLIKGCQTGKLKRIIVERANESDCTWRFDGEEISYAWDIVAWTHLPTAPVATTEGK